MNNRVPQITSLETAIRIYYEKLELGNKELKLLFGDKHSTSTYARLKNTAREKMSEEKVNTYNPNSVNTRVAFKAWGLDIADLEMRYQKLKKLSMLQPTAIIEKTI